MSDLFDENITCKDCGRKMLKAIVIKNGFHIRTLQCRHCKKKIYHPADFEEYKRFLILKQKPFAVKLRIVGNSYTVSIPKEIIAFQNQMHKEMQRQIQKMNKMVRLCVEDPWKLSLSFEDQDKKQDEEE